MISPIVVSQLAETVGEERGNPPKTFATRTNSGAALERITSAGTRIVVSRTEPPHASRGSEYASAPQDLLKAIDRPDEPLPRSPPCVFSRSPCDLKCTAHLPHH